jgi:hypothetical protein
MDSCRVFAARSTFVRGDLPSQGAGRSERSPARRLPRRRAGESLAVSIRGDENPGTAGDDRTPASGQAGAKLEGAFQADGLRWASIMGAPVRARLILLLLARSMPSL